MKPFLDEHFLLETKTAQSLFHEFAKELPIIDYHCHLPAQQISEDTKFDNLTQAWLYGDHYKWKAMRTNGVSEDYCTGTKTDWEKFQKWAGTVPYTLRNPLYHWTHLELQRYFGIREILKTETAKEIYHACAEKLQTPPFSVRNLLRRMKVKIVCTTDDPTDSLQYHQQLKVEGFEIRVLPCFRPDAAMKIEDPASFNNYLLRLERTSDRKVGTFSDYLDALKNRHDFFAANGCTLSDHGLENILADDFTEIEIKNIFEKARKGNVVSAAESRKFRSAMLLHFAQWDAEKGWVQQFHLGALRDNNSRMRKNLGPDTGWDSIGDFPQAESLAKFLNGLDSENKLAKTILYNTNPADNEVMATMIGNFNDGSVPGKIQWGAAWWFLDQKEGMINQLNALSNMGLLSRFVGMLTDSRSFLSFPRHEYFRRLLCNLFGGEMEKGELPDDLDWTGKLIQNICFHNAKNYFNWQSICP